MKVLAALITGAAPKYAARAARCFSTWGKGLPAGYDLKLCTGAALGVGDDYASLNAKTKAVAAHALAQGYDWLLKVDDDTEIRPSQLAAPDADYAGWATLDGVPEFPTAHCQGGCYWLSRRAFELVAAAPLDYNLTAEDRWVGVLLRDHGIRPLHLDDYVVNPACRWAAAWRPIVHTDKWTAMLQAG